MDSDPYIEVECACGVAFCFKCSKAPHSPCTCKMWDLWEEKINGDSETRNWLAANTKPCPKCDKPVEKNGGCNHVVCKCGQVRRRTRLRGSAGRVWQTLALALQHSELSSGCLDAPQSAIKKVAPNPRH